MSYMKYTPPSIVEQIRRIRGEHPGIGLLEAKRMAQRENALEAKQSALDALESIRWMARPEYSVFDHTVLDVLQYLVEQT